MIFTDEHSKDAWYYDEADMLDMDAFDEPDPDSDYDYEESYSAKRKRRKPRGGGHHPTRGHPPATESPGPKRSKVSLGKILLLYFSSSTSKLYSRAIKFPIGRRPRP